MRMSIIALSGSYLNFRLGLYQETKVVLRKLTKQKLIRSRQSISKNKLCKNTAACQKCHYRQYVRQIKIKVLY